MRASESDVLAAAEKLVECFGTFDKAAYFACFAHDATFTFYNYAPSLTSRAQYESLWDEWVSSGWRVTSCASSQQRVQMLSEKVAVFTHHVATVFGPEDPMTHERETIVFVYDHEWLAVHEHLSALPE